MHRSAFAYIFAGSGSFRDASEPQIVQTEIVGQEVPTPSQTLGNRSLVLFDSGDEVAVGPALMDCASYSFRDAQLKSQLLGMGPL